jgi:hypothetical protein
VLLCVRRDDICSRLLWINCLHALGDEVIRSSNIALTTTAALLRLFSASGDSAEAWQAATLATLRLA